MKQGANMVPREHHSRNQSGHSMNTATNSQSPIVSAPWCGFGLLAHRDVRTVRHRRYLGMYELLNQFESLLTALSSQFAL